MADGMTTGQMRRANAAGRFFPADPAALAARVGALLDEAGTTFLPAASPPLAVISPHAGYDFSGILTAGALAMARGAALVRVAVLSPSHAHAFDGIALPAQAGFAMPGAELAIDAGARAALVGAGLAHVEDAAHDREHGIETQLPFIAALWPGAAIVPMVIGRAAPEAVARALDALAALPGETLFVLSSDLSHFLNQAEAVARDRATAAKIETGKWREIGGGDACGARAIAGFLASRTGRGVRAMRLGMRTSHAVTGDAARVVGYGAWSLHVPGRDMLHARHRGALLGAARAALEARLREGRAAEPGLAGVSPRLQGLAASFVTLEKRGRLRGCIGSLMPHAPLLHDVTRNAVKAGFEDPRFGALDAGELEALRIKVSVLSRPAPMECASEAEARAGLVPGESGAILVEGARRGVFLPSVWESLPTREAFWAGLKRKAGLPESHWSESVEILHFRAEAFGEDG